MEFILNALEVLKELLFDYFKIASWHVLGTTGISASSHVCRLLVNLGSAAHGVELSITEWRGGSASRNVSDTRWAILLSLVTRDSAPVLRSRKDFLFEGALDLPLER